jgi:hypothetical protein
LTKANSPAQQWRNQSLSAISKTDEAQRNPLVVGSGQFPVDAIETGDFRVWRSGNIAVITG